ncbi:HD-GYP domain-containing protein [Butyrivibrio sp. AC2005]|uniref:HD-GYP domain-containing protein n=1 Tax=Butyrivibrio sp. AC2005 TaxID=1280672 RepID=UPI00040479CB|nr:HD domain-containing phosphohydrolase [Butyrivibrio sp. AC2005]
MLEIISYYWPRLIVALFFACVCTRFSLKKREGISRILCFAAFFFLSCTVISIASEILLVVPIRNILLRPIISDQITFNAVYGLVRIVIDLFIYVIPSFLCAKLVHEEPLIVGTVYMEFILQDRFAQIISFSPLSYMIVYIAEQIVLGLIHHKEMDYIFGHKDSVSWKPVFYYNLSLFITMDACYIAYLFVPDIGAGGISIPIIWIDALVIMSVLAAAGFSKLNITLSQEQEDKIEYMRKFQDNQTDIIRDFATISEAKSGETGQHVRRVSEYTAILARGAGLNELEVSYIKVAAMMHDIGKLMIPNEIIEKPGKLTPEEYETIKMHSGYGDYLLSHSRGEIMSMAKTIAYEHHERWDGTGYPRGLKGEEISLYARIVSVADVYDALTSARSYKEPWSPEEAKAEIVNQRGGQFAPEIVDVFVAHYDEIEAIRNKYTDSYVDED